MLCWSKQCQSFVKPHTPWSSLFQSDFQEVLLIKHFSWRLINYTEELLNRISHTNLLDERPTSPPCNSSPLVHRGSIEKRQTRHEVLVMCLGLHLGYLEKDKWYTVRVPLSTTRIIKIHMQPTKKKRISYSSPNFSPPERHFETGPVKFHTDDVTVQWLPFLLGCSVTFARKFKIQDN